MKTIIKILVMSLVWLGGISCDSDDDSGPKYTLFTATLNGANERPDPSASTATGTASLSFDHNTKKLTMTLNYTGLTMEQITMGHIHKGGTDEAGPVVFPLNITASPIMFESPVLSTQQESDLKNNLYYINLHTEAYPDGEIRGQIIKSGTSGGGGGGGGGGGY